MIVQVLVPARGFDLKLNNLAEKGYFSASLNYGSYATGQFTTLNIDLDKYDIIDVVEDPVSENSPANRVYDCKVVLKKKFSRPAEVVERQLDSEL